MTPPEPCVTGVAIPAPTLDPLTIDGESPHGLLVEETLAKLRRFFATKGHRPSAEMWEALADLASTMEAMVEGKAEPKIHLSSLDPGVGKSRTVASFIDSMLCHHGLYGHVGAMVCVSRLTEVEKMVRDIGIPSDMLCVYTAEGNRELNALGKAPMDQAQVLITTQQMLEKRLEGRSFNNASDFYFNGRPRALRLWDESYLNGRTLTLNRDDIAFLLRPLRCHWSKLTKDIEDLFTSLGSVRNGARFEIPDFASAHSVDLNDVLGIFDRPAKDNNAGALAEDQRQAVTALWMVSGKLVSVRVDGKYGQTAIDYTETLPADLAPLIVLDASGRVRETYTNMATGRQSLVRLKSASKRYDPLTVHYCPVSSGKSAFRVRGGELAEAVAKTINEKPAERFLVVTHKPSKAIGDPAKAIRDRLSIPQENVEFITWGSHSATNQYADIPNVILAGILFFRGSWYESLLRLSANRRAADGGVSDGELRRLTIGEHKHLILQAACRGTVRRCDGSMCHPMNLYMMASARSGIQEALGDIFPGCSVVPWNPLPPKLTGKVAEAVGLLKAWMDKSPTEDFLPFKRIISMMKMNRSDFRKRIREHSDFQSAVAALGLVEAGPNVYFTGFRRIVRDFSFYFPDHAA